MREKGAQKRKLEIRQIVPYCTAWATTYLIYLPFQDPINTIKFFSLTLGGILGLFYLIKYRSENNIKIFEYLVLSIFIVSLVRVAIDKNLYQAVFGSYGRKDGFITLTGCLILALTVYRYTTMNAIIKIFKFSLYTLVPLLAYGLLQSAGLDPIKWDNPYSRIVLTFGNPNFASAFLGIISSGLLAVLVLNQERKRRVSLIFITGICIFLIYVSDSQQGFLALAFGLIPTLIIFIKQRKRNLLKYVGSSYLMFLMLVVLGLFGKGALAIFLYQPSISLRGDYWRAGINMVRENIWTGVGIDNFGVNFPKYRDQVQVLRNVNVNADSAHNFFIQITATQGVFLGIVFALLTLFTLYVAVQLVFFDTEKQHIAVKTSVIGMWIAFQVQQFVSVENLGLKIWGWVLTALIFYFRSQKENLGGKSITISSSTHVAMRTSISLIILVALVSAWTFQFTKVARAETSVVRAYSLVINPANQNAIRIKTTLLEKVIEIEKSEKQYKFFVVDQLLSVGASKKAINVVKSVVDHEQDVAFLKVLARAYLFEKDLGKYEATLVAIHEIDKYNYLITTTLGLSICKRGNLVLAEQYFAKIQTSLVKAQNFNEFRECIEKKA